ncbi:AAA family ATPase [Aeromonas veronii]|uniref:AAA family ATPase n=1 Tax=Aeromonas veronii TaxID=654 RepID=UPI003D1C6BC8
MQRKKLTVKFTKTDVEPDEAEVVLFPSWRTWDDRGYKFSCRGMVRNPFTHSILHFETFIGFLPPKDKDEHEVAFFKSYLTNNSFEDMVGLINSHYEYESIDRLRFFTMLPTMGEYRKVVETLGVEFSGTLLNAINDLVYNKRTSLSWFDEAIKSRVFKLGFMRDSEPFFTFNNADEILEGLENERFDGISQNLTLRYTLDGFNNEHEIKLKYNSAGYIPKRINILIGKNGLGKSQSLRAFSRAALMYNDEDISLVDSETNYRPMINRLLAVATPGESVNTFPGERRTTQKLHYRRLSLTRNSKTRYAETIADQLIKLMRLNENIGTLSRWEIFKKTISKIAHIDKFVLVMNDGGYISLDKIDNYQQDRTLVELLADIDTSKEPRICYSSKPHALSSGQLIFFKFALLCCLHIENGSFILLDEPETHMHPNMISDFIDLLDTLLEETGSQALIATHSVYFVREVSREQVHIFKRNVEGNINISSPRLRTFGSDIDSISQFVFEEDIDSRLTDKIHEKIKNIPFELIEDELGAELSLSALMDLKSRYVK